MCIHSVSPKWGYESLLQLVNIHKVFCIFIWPVTSSYWPGCKLLIFIKVFLHYALSKMRLSRTFLTLITSQAFRPMRYCPQARYITIDYYNNVQSAIGKLPRLLFMCSQACNKSYIILCNKCSFKAASWQRLVSMCIQACTIKSTSAPP